MNQHNKKIIITLVVIVFILAATLIGIMAHKLMNTDTKKLSYETGAVKVSSSKNSGEKGEPPILNIISCPEQVNADNPEVVIEGVAISENSVCSVKINGETVAISDGAGIQKKWSKTYRAVSGETLVLKVEATDENGNKTTEERSVYCQILKTKEEKEEKEKEEESEEKEDAEQEEPAEGCAFVKKKPGGLNIRENVGTDAEVAVFIEAEDYDSELKYTGNYEVDGDDYTWYEVIAPDGKKGYVRSDLVKIKE